MKGQKPIWLIAGSAETDSDFTTHVRLDVEGDLELKIGTCEADRVLKYIHKKDLQDVFNYLLEQGAVKLPTLDVTGVSLLEWRVGLHKMGVEINILPEE